MDETIRQPIRVLIADDEAPLRDAYRHILVASDPVGIDQTLAELRARLLPKAAADAARPAAAKPGAAKTHFDATFCNDAESAVAAVREALAAGRPFAVAFIDMRMPPGPDGVWAAGRIRDLDPAIEIVICTAYADVDAGEIAGLVPPEEKLSYLQKPFHPGEIRQMALSLASKWRAENRILKLAYFDTLTGLPNREQLRNRMASAIAAAEQRRQSLAVLYLDLDNFKRVNDTLGHAHGDQLLCTVAAVIRHSLRSSDLISADVASDGRGGQIARLGGDEFIVILPNLQSIEDAGRVAARLVADVKKPIRLGDHSLVITPSIGIAVYPRDGADAESLLRHADLAMYFAKRAAPGSYEFFAAGMNDGALRRFAIEEKLHGALERGEFSLQFQPQFDVQSGAIAGMEALLRWDSPELGSVPPIAFIPVAEQTGLILPIGEWVLRNACLQARVWREDGLPPVRMAVNVSGRQFMLKEFPDLVAAVIADTGIDPQLLELEITESVVMQDEDASARAFAQLKRLGVGLAIDDFGTGYSSFGRLRNFSVNRLKIDRSFLTSLVECNDDQAIAKALIAMTRSLRISVTAEGVENFPQLAFLQEQQCNEAQGYLLSHPLQPVDALALLRRAAAAAETGRTARLRALVS